MTPEQRELLEDKIRIWRQEAKWGNMDLRDYNRRCADALEAALGKPGHCNGVIICGEGKRG